jgi:hypothetical protein
MKRTLIVAAIFGASVVIGPASAHAAAHDLFVGGCGSTAEPDPAGPDAGYSGVMYDTSLTTDPAGLPTYGTVSCWVQVNGVEAPGTRSTYSGFGVQSGTHPLTFSAGVGDVIEYCEAVVFADGTTGPEYPCGDPNLTVPPPTVIALLEIVFSDTDPVVCPKLASLAGVYGPLTIEPDGDVYVNDPFGLIGWTYDCPSYGNFAGSPAEVSRP